MYISTVALSPIELEKLLLQPSGRYDLVTEEKSGGATYTPQALANFVALQIAKAANGSFLRNPIRVLDPAVGHGELLASLLKQLPRMAQVEVYGFDTDEDALKHAANRLQKEFPRATYHLRHGDFLRFVLEMCGGMGGLFEQHPPETYDLIIANPPYVRTQIIGAEQAQNLAENFELSGRVDLYYAFILAMTKVLRPHGIAGIIVSNRFMTTKAGAIVRRALKCGLNLLHIWDLGDTKLFDAAVLPVVILGEGRNGQNSPQPAFTTIYETKDVAESEVLSSIEALDKNGVVRIADGRSFRVRQGKLDGSGDECGVWRLSTASVDAWISKVAGRTWCEFGDIGKIRVGVKTCADEVFIRSDWDAHPEHERPELLRELTTHHVARRFKAAIPEQRKQIVYPHESRGGKRQCVDLDSYPRTRAYLEKYRGVLEGRKYVLEANRRWYEIWVPQDPGTWGLPKLVFRDISEKPCFWMDQDGTVINGDCYWMTSRDSESLWMALAVGNSSFIEAFYDHCFNNKLYAGRRRFITQYVEKFPLPDPNTKLGKMIVERAKTAYAAAGTAQSDKIEEELDRFIWQAFGLNIEEIAR